MDPLGLSACPSDDKSASKLDNLADQWKAENTPSSVANSGIFNKGGRFADLDKVKRSGEVGHHIPQDAFNKSNGLSRSDGPGIGMTTEEHALTRTFAGKGKGKYETRCRPQCEAKISKGCL